jgi:hypothetical protein
VRGAPFATPKKSSPDADAGAASDATKNGARDLPLGALAALAGLLPALPGLLALLARLLLAATALLTAALMAALMLAALAALAALLAALVRIAHDRSCVRFAPDTHQQPWRRMVPAVSIPCYRIGEGSASKTPGGGGALECDRQPQQGRKPSSGDQHSSTGTPT